MNSSITYREIVYFVIDELKLISDDSTFTPEHIIFLADKMRAKLLYKDIKMQRKETLQEVIIKLLILN